MMEFLQPGIELLVILPGILLACLPMKQHLRVHPGKFAAAIVPLFLLLCIAGGGLCYAFSWKTKWIYLPIAVIAGLIYVCALRISHWKSVSVLLGVYGVFTCLGSVAEILDLILCPGNPNPWLSLPMALLYNLLCWTFVGLTWYPATHAARELVENTNIAKTWCIFWILPLLFIALNLFIAPIHPELMYQGRIMQIYLVVDLALLLLLLLFYTMFYLMATSLNRNSQLQQENYFLSMQQARYDSLKTTIEETREARHDMRHHFDVLLGLAGRGEWEALTKYLSDTRGAIPAAELHLCDNPAVDSVAGHYALLCRKAGIPCSFMLDLPVRLPVPEIDLCLVLSNLLENALEASLKTFPSKQDIRVQAYLHSGQKVLLTVENAFEEEIREKNGVLQSSKRRGAGVGTQSVRHIAEKNGGYCRFLYEDGRFCSNVMLRGKSE